MSEVRVTLGWLANAVGGRIRAGNPDQVIGNVTTDTRTLQRGDFFIALRGPRFDGHAFLAEAFGQGAIGAMVELVGADLAPHRAGVRGGGPAVEVGPYDMAAAPDVAIVEVPDTTRGLQDLAHAVRQAAGTRVVAITGSTGKTTTKETIAELLSARFKVVKNKGNLNNHIGLPLSLMQLRGAPDVAVMELGMNHAGEISTLVAIAEPDVRVWTNVGDAHLGFFDSADAIADAKAEILERADRDDVLVCNADDPRIMSRVGAFVGKIVTFGTAPTAVVRAENPQVLGIDGIRARLVTPSGARDVQTPLLGRGNLSNILAATAVALEFEIPLERIVSTAAHLRPANRRGAVHRLRDGVVLIDDSYNSSPAALKRALEVVTSETRPARKVAVLGEMLELGTHAVALHEECGRAVAAAGLDLLFTVGGPSARALAHSAVAAGIAASAVKHFDGSDRAADVVVASLRPGDLVLVKGSRGTRTDVVADRIMAEFR